MSAEDKQRNIKEELTLHSLFRFFAVEENVRHLIKLLSPESKVTRSLLDWFVTSYVKSHTVEYVYNNQVINVNSRHRTQLKEYGKKQNDPFCRGGTFILKTGISECPEITTSSRQLCFMRWAIQNGVLTYVEDNYDMLRSMYNKRKKTPLKGNKRTKMGFDGGFATKEKDHRVLHVNVYTEPYRVRF